jgi:hypothetical protein
MSVMQTVCNSKSLTLREAHSVRSIIMQSLHPMEDSVRFNPELSLMAKRVYERGMRIVRKVGSCI